jgi:sugar transferase (PEP-CTERM/EpsH1 system associated)
MLTRTQVNARQIDPSAENPDEDAPLNGNRKLPLLFLCHRIPYPPDKGDKIRAFHLLRHLSQHFDIYLASFVDDKGDWKWAEEVKKYCRKSFLRPLNPRQATLRSLRGLFTGNALSLPYYSDLPMQDWVARICAVRNIRHTLVYSSVMAQFLPNGGKGFERKIIDFVDVDSDKWLQYAKQKPWPMSSLYRREARYLLRCEQELAERFDAGLFVSSAEATLFHTLAPGTAHKIDFYNNGVDCAYFDPDPDIAKVPENPFPTDCKALVFTGAMDYWPNVDAVTWFVHQVLPALRAEHPELACYIVGSNPTPQVQRLTRLPGVLVTGRVPDVRPYLMYCLAAIAPMRVARGVQNKVLEAMAMACPVLVSPKGLEGIKAKGGEHVLLADSPEEYRRWVGEIIAGSHPHLGERARQCVQTTFDWDQNLPKVVSLLAPDQAISKSCRDSGRSHSHE